MQAQAMVGVVDVSKLLPDGVLPPHVVDMYAQRSPALGMPRSYVGKSATCSYIEWAERLFGTECLDYLPWGPVFPYVPHPNVFEVGRPPFSKAYARFMTKARSKAWFSRKVQQGYLRLPLVPGTKVVPVGEAFDAVVKMLERCQAVCVRFGDNADGGYGLGFFERDEWKRLRAFLRMCSSAEVVVAPKRDVKRVLGVGVLGNMVIPPNSNIIAEDGSCIGVTWPNPVMLRKGTPLWLLKALWYGVVFSAFIRKNLGEEELIYANLDLIGGGGPFVTEANAQETMGSLTARAAHRVAKVAGAYSGSFPQFFKGMAWGHNGFAVISNDKIACLGHNDFGTVADCLIAHGVLPFDGEYGWYPGHDVTDFGSGRKVGLGFVCKAVNSSKAFAKCEELYEKGVAVLAG